MIKETLERILQDQIGHLESARAKLVEFGDYAVAHLTAEEKGALCFAAGCACQIDEKGRFTFPFVGIAVVHGRFQVVQKQDESGKVVRIRRP